ARRQPDRDHGSLVLRPGALRASPRLGLARARPAPVPGRARRRDRAHEARDARHSPRLGVGGAGALQAHLGCLIPRMDGRPVAVIGAGLDLGQGRRGVDMGPSAIRYAELNARLRELGLEAEDWGDVTSPVPETTTEGRANARYLEPIKAVCAQL